MSSDCPRSQLVHFRDWFCISGKVYVKTLHGNQVAVAFSLDVERMAVFPAAVDVVGWYSSYSQTYG